MSTGGHSRRTSGSVGSRSNYRSTTPSNPPPQLQVRTSEVQNPAFQPCASTSSMFLYAQDKSIICLHHDSLAIERRFEKHKQKVVILAIDTVSERGQGRLVVSYDAEQTAIVWDLYTGDELARFSSFEPFTNASWMKNGNIAFGSEQGNVVIFEPSTTEHKSRRTIFDPITSIAPASDCQTYAIGYQNGSVLIASLEPQFTILHTLSTSRAPSPVAALAWHASSSKQRSDMLAIQMADGDLRVWSVGKSTSAEAPKVIRVLKRGDDVDNGRNWIAWSKNGRVLQYSQGETWSWDVRTKHVAYEQVPTVEEVRGISNYGPNAVLFTLGPEGSVQQYELNPPSLVRAVQPELDERASAQNTPKINPSHIIGAAPPVPIYNAMDPSRPGAHSLATIKEATSQSAIEHAQRMRNGVTSPVSTSSRTESVSSRSSNGAGNYRDRAPSVSSRAPSGTVFSAFSTPMIPRESVASPFWASASVASSGRRSRGSRLKNEVLRSPDTPMVDLFPFTRQRLAGLPYAPQNAALDQNTASASDLRQQMLHIVFGWEGDIDELIRGEMNKHPQGSTSAALLGKWLGETNLDPMSMMMSNSISSTDWMLLALSNMNGNGEAGKEMGRTLAQKHINQGDIHTAATIYVGIEELEEAVDIYVSRNYFMEGILLTALLFPEEWQRQAHLVRRWGEYVVENSQQHLAIRCFTCTGTDSSVPWASPSQSPFTGSNPAANLNSMISPPTSPEGPSKAQMMTSKNPALRLITSFGAEKPQYKFPGLRTDDGTPTMAPGITPIADSALSPGGTPGGVRLPRGAALLGKSTGGGHSRLPSIGETPIDVNPPMLPIPNTVKRLPTPETSGSDREKEPEKERKSTLPSLSLNTQDLNKKKDDAPLLLSATVYNPNEEDTPMPHGTPQTALKGTPQTAHPITAQKVSHSEGYARNRLNESSRTRNGSRDRKPNGLHIQMPSLNQVNLPQLTAGSDQSGHFRGRHSESSSLHSGSTASGKFPLRERLRDLDSSGEPSAPLTGKSWASSAKSPSVSGRSMDQYISSLEAANWNAKQRKEAIKLSRSKERKSKARDAEEASARGRTSMRYIQPPKRSPSSPVPMSPEDLQQYRDANSQSIDSSLNLNLVESSTDDQQLRGYRKPRGMSKGRSVSKVSEMSSRTAVREASPDARVRHSSRKGRSRAGSRLTSPERLLSPIEARGRSTSKGPGSHARSPSSPLPFSPQADLYREHPSPDPLRLVAENKARLRSRQSSRQRSTSRVPRERGSSRSRVRREQSQDRRISDRYGHAPQLSESSIPQSPEKRRSDPPSDSSPGLKPAKSMRTIKKEQAARELEARRVSLIAHSQQTLVHPSELSARPAMPDRSFSDNINPGERQRGQWTPPGDVSSSMFREGAPNPHERSASTGPLLGLPATPRAMKHPKYQAHDVPAMPAIPDEFYATGQPKFEPSRSVSAPVPEPGNSNDGSGVHPAYQRNIRPSAMANRRPSFQPLHEIGRPRQGSIDAGNSQHMGSIDGALHPIIEGEGDHGIIIVPETRTPGHSTPTPTPPPFILPQLAHLASGGVNSNNHGNNNDAIPPPPPPPPPPPFADNFAHHSLSSGSGVGTINIVMDEDDSRSPHADMNAVAMAHATAGLNLSLPSTSYAHAPRGESLPRNAQRMGTGSNNPSDNKPLPPSPSAHIQSQGQRSHTHMPSSAGPRSPPAQQTADPMESIRAGAASPPQSGSNVGGGHRRGRSIDGIGSKTMRVFERMRSNSRGRNENAMREREKKTKSPKLLTEGFGDGIQSGLERGQRAPYETAGTYF